MRKFYFLWAIVGLLTFTTAFSQSIPTPKEHFGFEIGEDYKLATYTATDAAANSVSASFTITVSDTENPSIVGLPNNIITNNTPGVCDKVVTWIAPTATDNCPGSTITQTAGPASGSAFLL